MWEEDPRYQAGNLGCGILMVTGATFGVFGWSAWTGEWSYLGYWLLFWLGVGVDLLLYAGLLWLVCHGIERAVWTLKRRCGGRAQHRDDSRTGG